MKGFKDVRVYKENEGIVKGAIQFENGKISSFDACDELLSLGNKYIVVPGFIDEHIHGANGSDAMYATKKNLENIATSIAQDGVTSFLATTMSMDLNSIKKALKAIGDYESVNGATILGVHLEGPFISKKYCGAQDPNNIIKADISIVDDLINCSKDKIRIITLAYEETDANVLNYLINHNILINLGHSDSNASQAKEAFKNGANCLTHTYNAMRGIHHRDIGLLGEGLINDDIYCELIADLHHVSADAIKLLYRNKPKDKVLLITDSMEARFLPNGEYELGGQKVYVKDGVATLSNGVLAGSVLRMNDAIRNVKNVLNISLTTAIDLATKNVANHLKLNNKGSIALGKDADLVVIDDELNVYMTIVNGKIVFQKENM